ncbi:MAG: hypothetical protein EBS82_04330 [Methylocystaceae bacterium]|jgi:hypothetical protein|nr:hypothetical protein [Methylocystaceae bacterium]NBT97137.1 hypothetical protein [Methylocystaceae bacterium]
MAKECLSDFTIRLRDKGVSDDAINEITSRLIHDRVEAMAAAAAAYHLNNPTTLSSFAEKLSSMTRRCYGVSTAVSGLRQVQGDVIFDGVDQLLMDLIESAERLERDFEAIYLADKQTVSE